jgi:hypothetical protein
VIPAALLIALYAFIAGLVAGWVMEPDTPANSTPANSTPANSTPANSTLANSTLANSTLATSTLANSDPIPWWLALSFGLAWPFVAVVLALLVSVWWLHGWRPDPRGAAPNRPAGRGPSHTGLP